jgi:hypothetical protein
MPVSFTQDIRHLFTDEDIEHMSTFFDLASYDDNKSHAQVIIRRLKGEGGARRMPPPPRPPWPPENIQLYEQWVKDGFSP